MVVVVVLQEEVVGVVHYQRKLALEEVLRLLLQGKAVALCPP